MTNTKNLRFAPVIRVSTEKQEARGESLNTQTEQIKGYVSALNGTIPDSCWKYSGQEHATPDQERKKLDQLLADAEKNTFDAVICADASRWSRDNRKSKEGLDILKRNGIRFFIGTTEYDLFDPAKKLFLGMSAEIGEFQAHEQSRKSILNRIARAKKNIPTSGKLPYGRTFDKKSKQWGIDPHRQDLVKSAARRYCEGENIKSIAATLGFNRSTLYTILTQQCGTVWDVRFRAPDFNIDETVTMKVPPLLDKKTIDRIHAQVDQNKNHRRGNRKWFFLLSGFVFCKHCGVRYNVYRNQGGKKYYRHRKVKSNEHCHVPKVLPAPEIENAVLLQLLATLGDPERMEQALARAEPDMEKRTALLDEREDLEAKLKKVEQAKDFVIDQVADGILGKEETRKKMTKLRDEESAITERLAVISQQVDTIPDPEHIRRASKLGLAVARHVARDPKKLFSKDPAWKLKLVREAFAGQSKDGKPNGVYVNWTGDHWEYEVRGAFAPTVKSLPIDDNDLIDYFKIDPHYQDVEKELKKIRSNLVGSCQLEHHQGG